MGVGVAGLGLDIGVVRLGVGVIYVLSLGVIIGVVIVVAAGTGICFKMRPRSVKYHNFTCSSIVDMCGAIKSARSVFLFFRVTLVLRRSSMTSSFVINADHRMSDFFSLLAVLF
ncbi:Ribosomal RNA small subunit methyltransferase E [Hordeum vulgare]|nr:Ribosomal RNA small subunit methyltransferase E [Hordeum vulgare]